MAGASMTLSAILTAAALIAVLAFLAMTEPAAVEAMFMVTM